MEGSYLRDVRVSARVDGSHLREVRVATRVSGFVLATWWSLLRLVLHDSQMSLNYEPASELLQISVK